MTQEQAIRRRNPDGTLGDYEPLFEAPVSDELINAYTAIAMQQAIIDDLTKRVAALEIAAKGGGQA